MDRRIGELPGLKPQRPGKGDHRAVVRAQRRTRETHAAAALGCQLRQLFAQPGVGADAAGNDQGVAVGRIQCTRALDRQGVDHGILESTGDVGPRLGRLVAPAPRQQHLGLEAAEAEVQSGPVGHRPRELVRARSPGFGEFCQLRAAGIRQSHHLCGLVEGFAGGVVQGLAEQPVLADGVDRDQLGMAAGHQQRQERRRQVRRLQQWRQQMAFHVMDADRGLVQRPRQRSGHASANEQRADQARTCGVGDAVKVTDAHARLGQSLLDQGQQFAHVVAAGQLRHHPAIFGMQRDLAVERLRQQAVRARQRGVVDGHAGLVAGSFDAEDFHVWHQH